MIVAARRPAEASRRGGDEHAVWVDDGLVREQFAGLQRARMLVATFDVAAQRGAAGVSIAEIVERSGVSRRTFYEHFADRDDCLVAAFERALALVSERVVPAWEGKGRWHERVRAALTELLSFCEEQPSLARFLLVDSFSAGTVVLLGRDDLARRVAGAIDQGRTEAPKSADVGPLTAEGVVGGVSAMLMRRLSAGSEHPVLLTLTSELTSMIVLPYLGAAAARREAGRPAPERVANGTSDRRDGTLELREANMRLTYRTVRVLAAIAEHPGASNRVVGDIAEIRDQGQISKLLSRLERVGLIENTQFQRERGAPNSWALTEKGRRIAEGIRLNSERNT